MHLKHATVFIGRFQPFHNAHEKIVEQALKQSDKLIIIIGSANEPRTFKNPFTAEERKLIIESSEVYKNNQDRIVIESTYDTLYNDDAWALRVQMIVNRLVDADQYDISIIGHKKDESSFYLDMFRQWGSVGMPSQGEISATDIRNIYFNPDMTMDYISTVVPPSALQFLQKFKQTGDYQNIIEEKRFVENYKKQFESYPYPPTFVTVDAVVVQSGYVLMVKRRARPGKGLWAIPGGFLDAASDVSLKAAMLRELREETGLKIPEKILEGSMLKQQVFDAIGRSTRGRTITHAFYIRLDDSMPLPKVKGHSDAEKAQWIPISELEKSKCYEDHWEIIQSMMGCFLL